MSVDLVHIQQVIDEADCLYRAEALDAAIRRMAGQISAELAGTQPLLLCVMNGALVFAGKLLPELAFALEVGYVHATRYRGATEGGELHWLARPPADLGGREVLILDDILDEGHTLAAIREECLRAGALRVRCAVLIDKQHARKAAGLQADFVGLYCEDRYLFGYGMDYQGYWRNAPGIFAVRGR
ncbi:hypoxanthine-guanine phosphoribosyltransferase [Pseudomonas sp. NW5]|uniref:hypoxanthine-guanine phosphoribosyltransferase n=1 Tax=Pseudomonas sp. NW5 TaxID=2934934 RepID=UPI002021CB3B|nr:hypoxanthine-guanine phosphoribosyltransferase [Pseudomonas sp. NW5]MCL7461768.1 hypoxanthine-guanine phosphoribosyltransferase [Pseudomonas sp. NW5]